MSDTTPSAATILVVDDTPTKLYILSSWLRRAGYAVVEATAGLEALRRIAELHPDLVVLDVRLPDISGYEVCERIKNDPATSSIPVIQISGAAITAADRALGLHRGADGYLAEPIEPDEFVATVEAALRYHRARQRAERLAGRLGALTDLTLAMNAAQTFDELLSTAVSGTSRILGRTAGVVALAPDGRTRRLTAVPPDGTVTVRSSPPGALETLGGRALGQKAGIEFLDVPYDYWTSVAPDTPSRRDIVAVVARTKRDRPPILLGLEPEPELDQDELSIMRQIGQAVALAVEALRAYAEEHAIALTLQRSLLPSRVPQVPGLDIVWRYQPAVDNVEVGGDFYEVLELGDQVLVAVGDVQGHSLLAATVMAELRHALRASLIGKVELDQSLSLLNDVLRRYHPRMTATVCLTLLDPATGEAQIANAGHIPPLLLGGDGTARYHEHFGNLLLGVAEEVYRIDRVVVPPGGSVLMFTDGLVEDRDKYLDDSLEIARRTAEGIGDDMDEAAGRLIDTFGAREDDVALVIVRRHRAPGGSQRSMSVTSSE
ncbi:fused response regulator/phosphatase [Actinomadura sp. ATCC 31491]|uniref:Fused response regulator/phosphatase n=1 Tax=Actinomadura luzonensis TaxID=2805427 RepID=A0ABT0FVM2_9ACTN|nr:fused response regulator/phosphatase [Actinomadura luzonensis]MCK2216383.1 fused response regulator/phosphatase [Actinomadura luzonensis]